MFGTKMVIIDTVIVKYRYYSHICDVFPAIERILLY